MRKTFVLPAALALVAVVTLFLSGALAGEEAPATPAAGTPAPAVTAPTTKTATPVLSMLGWIGERIKATPGAKQGCTACAMKTWFAGGKDVPLAGMRDRLLADGWTAPATIRFFKRMAAKGDCQGCDGAKGKCADCDGNCPCQQGAAKGKCKDCAGAKGKCKDCAGAKGKCKDCAGAKGNCKDCAGAKGKCKDCDGNCPCLQDPTKGDCEGCDGAKGDCPGCDRSKPAAPAKPAKEQAGS